MKTAILFLASLLTAVLSVAAMLSGALMLFLLLLPLSGILFERAIWRVFPKLRPHTYDPNPEAGG